MKTKVLTGLLVGALLFTPSFQPRARAQSKDGTIIMIGCAILVLGIGIVVIVELNKVCKRLPPMDPPPQPPPPPPVIPPPTNNIPTNNIPTNPPPFRTAMRMADLGVTYQDVSALGMVDTNAGYPAPIMVYTTFKFQTSTNAGCCWKDVYYATGWLSTAGTILVWCDTNGLPLWTNYCQKSGVSHVPLSLGTGTEPQAFYRMLSEP